MQLACAAYPSGAHAVAPLSAGAGASHSLPEFHVELERGGGWV